MKKAILFLSIAFCLFGCKQKEEAFPEQVQLGKEFGLKYQGKTTLAVANSSSTSIVFSNLKESRCIGENIVCISAGVLNFDLNFSDGQILSFGVTDWLTDKKVSYSDKDLNQNPKRISVKLDGPSSGNANLLVYVERVEIKDPNRQAISATPKENYTLRLKIVRE